MRTATWVLLSGAMMAEADAPPERVSGPDGRALLAIEHMQTDAEDREIWSSKGGRRNYDDSTRPAAAAPTVTFKSASQSSARPWTTVVASPSEPSVLSSPSTVSVNGNTLLTLEWYRVVFGAGIGATGLHTVDLDGDGALEIVAGAGGAGFGANRYWYILGREGTGYSHRWSSLPYPDPLLSLAVAQVDADSALEVLVGTGAQILIYDGATHALQQSITTGSPEIRDLTVADVDGDGTLELVFCSSTDLFVVDFRTGLLEFRGAGLGGRSIAVGALDSDPALEIVVGNGTSPGRVVDGATHAVEWTLSTGFGDKVRMADVDGDGRDEIVAASSWYTGLCVFDGDTQTLVWQLPVFNLAAVRIADVEQDGRKEVIFGDAQWGRIHVLDGATGAEKWSLDNPEHGVTDVAVGDVDADGTREILWGAGYTSSGPDYLYVADSATRLREWRSVDINGPFRGLDYGDVDADGRPELIYASLKSESGYGDGLFFVHDAQTHALEFQSPAPTGLNWTGLARVRTANVDHDPQREIFILTGYTYDGLIICYDGLTHAEQWRTARLPSGLSFVSLQVADLEGDGSLELIAGVRIEHTGAPGKAVYVYDAATGALKWQSAYLPTSMFFGGLPFLRVADVIGDALPEIVVAASDQLWVIDAATHGVVRTISGQQITALETPDRDGNGIAEIVIGTQTGAIRVVDPLTGAVTQTIGTYGGPINGLVIKDITGDTIPDYVFARGNRLRLVNGTGGPETPLTDPLTVDSTGTSAGADDSLFAADIDGDGRLEIVANVGLSGVIVFEVMAGADVVPPMVAVTAPPGGSTVRSITTIAANASDDFDVLGVQFFVNGALIGTATTEPYSVPWDASPYAGPTSLTAKAYDEAGNVGASTPVVVLAEDVRPPTVSLTAPAYGSRVTGIVALAVSASDNGVVARVEFYVNGVLLGADVSAPYTLSWDATPYAGTSPHLQAKAIDGVGNSAFSSSVTVTVPELVPPTAMITAPANGATVMGTVTVTASATDNVGVTRVELYVNGLLLAIDTTAPYRFTWNTLPYSGTTTLQARAHDPSGNVGQSPGISVIVPDTAIITTPVNGSAVSGIVSIAVSAAYNAGVGRVDFFIDGALRGSDTTAPYAFGWDTTTASDGAHSLQAKVFDAAGNLGLSPTVSVVVDTIAPTATITAPSEGTWLSGVVSIAVTAADNVAVGRVDFFVDSVLRGSDTTAPYAFGWNTAVVSNGAHSLQARAFDTAGNMGLSPTVSVVVDTIAPTATITTPTDGSMVSGVVSIAVSATDNVALQRVDFFVDGVLRGSDTTAPYAFGWNTATVSEGLHSLQARAFDAAGNMGSSPTVWVILDVVKPTATITTPTSGSTVSGVVSIAVSATDDFAVGRVEFLIDGALRSSDTSAPYAFDWDAAAASNGAHSLQARAFDTAGNVGLSPTLSVVVDTIVPMATITEPIDVSMVHGVVSIAVSAADNVGVQRVEFFIDGAPWGSDTTAPYSLDWDTAIASNGVHSLQAKSFDTAGNLGTSPTILVTVHNSVDVVYDSVLRAPRCAAGVATCDSGALLSGRGAVGPETHQPNTTGETCTDGDLGTYHNDESNDRIRVVTLDGTPLAAGKTVGIEATVWAWIEPSADSLDLYTATDANAPAWTFLTTLTPPAPGLQVLSTTFVLPAGALQAVRAQFRYQGSAVSPCSAGMYDDHDDLIFAVQ